jgi:hypothetical protein
LADAGISGQNIGILHHGLVRGVVSVDFEHTAPLGKSGTILFVLHTALSQVIKTYTFKQASN